MLKKDTVEENTFRILKVLQEDKNLTGFYLVGGTALALKMGHRRSVDLDLFSPESFDTQVLTEYLSKQYGFEKAYPNRISKVILQGFIENVRVDWVVNKYPFVENPELIEGVRLYSLKDIAAMKLTAIADTGSRLKDFVDVAYMSTVMSLNEMLEAYVKKYNIEMDRAIRSLTYFSEIDFTTKIDLIDAEYRFDPINARLHDMKRHPGKVFPDKEKIMNKIISILSIVLVSVSCATERPNNALLERQMSEMPVHTNEYSFSEDFDGNLGQDVLMHFDELILNFEDMYLTFGDKKE